MATVVSFEPKIIDFKVVPPESVGHPLGDGVIAFAPSDATVTASLMGDQEHFRVVGIRSYSLVRRRFTREEIDEFPPASRETARRATIVEDILVGESDGQTPLAVQKRQKVIVSVRYFAQNLTPDQDTYTATLLIAGDTWEPFSIPVIMLIGQVETTFPNNVVTVRQGLGAPLPFVVRSLAGPDTTVLYLKQRGAAFSDNFDMTPLVVSVPRGQTVNGSFLIKAPPDAWVGSYTQSDIMQFAFDGKQVNFLETTVNVIPGLVTATLAQSGNLVAKQGETAKCAIKFSTTAQVTSVVLTPAGTLPQGVLAQTKDVTVFQASTVVTEFEFQIDGNAPLVTNYPITINWSTYGGEQTGSLSVTLTILPGLGIPTRRFNPAMDGFRFPNQWAITEEDARAMRERFESVIPELMTIQIALIRQALNGISLTPIPFAPSISLPDFIVAKVIEIVAGEVVRELNDKIVGAMPGEDYGRCGGMAFAGYDFFLRGWLVNQFGDGPADPSTGLLRPPASGELRTYIWLRLLDSLNLNALRFFEWIADLHVLPVISKAATIALLGLAGSVAGPVGVAIGALIGSQTDIFKLGGARVLRDRTREEMKKLQDKLNREAAWPIGLVYGHTAIPIEQHQILAVGYTDHGNNTATLNVWDNNDGNKGRTLTLDFRGEELVVTQVLGPNTVDQDKPIKGIFCEEYSSQQPPLSLKRP